MLKQLKIPKECIKYAIARKGANYRNNCDFVSTLSHEFAGKKEVLGFSILNQAIHFDDEENANKIYNQQPEWVHRRCEVIAFEKTNYGECHML